MLADPFEMLLGACAFVVLALMIVFEGFGVTGWPLGIVCAVAGFLGAWVRSTPV